MPKIKQAADTTPTRSPSVHKISAPKVTKEEQELLVDSAALSKDDMFQDGLFSGERGSNALIRPPFPPRSLEMLLQMNNSLQQCITAYEVNIDGTGYEIERASPSEDTGEEVDEAVEGVRDFFQECYPEISFVTVRRQLRRDLETVGYAFMEVLRSVSGRITFMRRLDPKPMRLVRLDDAVPVTTMVRRFGEMCEITMRKRERRFAQADTSKFGSSGSDDLVYFREYGSSRQLDNRTGKWSDRPDGSDIPIDQRATEIIYFTVYEDVDTAYGLPRWVNQTPSVLGSRKAEELNLDFFRSGGIPPIMLLVEGGFLTSEVREQLEQYFRNSDSDNSMAAIVEVHGSGGDLNSASKVEVKVERFGADLQKDSMYENYDTRSEARIRSSFRLAPIFVGRTDDYSFATAFASYTVAEAQVFKPERMEFDEVINATIMSEINMMLGIEEPDQRIVFRSLPLNTVDIQNKLRAFNIVKDVADPESFITEVNEAMEFSLTARDTAPAGAAPMTVAPELESTNPQDTPVTAPSRLEEVNKADLQKIITLAHEWVDMAIHGDVKHAKELREVTQALSPEEQILFARVVCGQLMDDADREPEGAEAIVMQATHLIAGCCDHDHGDS